MNKRIKNHTELSSQLSYLDNKEINELLNKNIIGSGWGKNHELVLSGRKVFVKSVPLTNLEMNNSFSTKNLYKLPLYYNYGVGSAGIGAFRELSMHIKTTNWVLSGECESFPLMHHYRIAKKANKPKKLTAIQKRKHSEYIKYWNNSKQIDRYILERKSSEYEIVIFLEYIPHVFMNWLKPNISRIEEMTTKVLSVFNFLKSKGVIHFDAHFGNILTDGNNVFLSDFGLTLDRHFKLSKLEQSFFKKHHFYDHMEYLGCCSTLLESYWHDLDSKSKMKLESDLNITSETQFFEKIEIMLSNLEKIQKIMRLNRTYVKFLNKYLTILRLSNDFFFQLRKDNRKRTVYPCDLVTKALKKSI